MNYDNLTLEQAEAMSADQFAALPLSVQQRIVSEYIGRPVTLSDRHDTGNKEAKTCPRGHVRSVHSKYYSGELVCVACKNERRNATRADKRKKAQNDR